MNKIELKFNKTLSSIAGYELGEEIYNTQVKDFYKKGEENIIVFPKEIERVAISFIQGFIAGLIEEVGYTNMLNELKVEGQDRVVKRFYEVM